MHANELEELELMPFRNNVSSLVSGFMLVAIIQEAGFDISFIATSTGAKSCDLLVKKSYKAEVKTFLDKSKKGRKIESSLVKEIECTLKRDKAVEDINDSLSKRQK